MRAPLSKFGLAAIATLAFSSAASAAVTISGYSPGSSELAVPGGEILVDDFEGGPVQTGFTFTGGTLFTGSQTNVHDDPAGDASTYVVVLGGPDVATLTTPTTISALSLYIGSVDTWNSISFYTGDNVLINTILGPDLRAAAGGSSTVDVTDGRFFFDLAGQNVDAVTFSSSQNSMEFDNIAASVPEPGVWAMMLLGMGGLGYALRRRRFASEANAIA
jgi:hypothetical protein